MKFTLRELFWLILMVAIGCAWWLDHSQLTTSKRKFLDAIYEAGYTFVEDGDELRLSPSAIIE